MLIGKKVLALSLGFKIIFCVTVSAFILWKSLNFQNLQDFISKQPAPLETPPCYLLIAHCSLVLPHNLFSLISFHLSLISFPLPFPTIFLIFEYMGIALEKSRKFAIRVYNLYKYLCDEKHEYTLAKQLLRSGTSIGANLTEAQYAVSKKEFLVKATISLKECAETEYWLDLLKETNLLTEAEHTSITKDSKDLLHLLLSITKTTKKKLEAKKSEK